MTKDRSSYLGSCSRVVPVNGQDFEPLKAEINE